MAKRGVLFENTSNQKENLNQAEEPAAFGVKSGEASVLQVNPENVHDEEKKLDVKVNIREEKTKHEKLDALISESSNVLYELKAVFPFDFFPDQIVIDPEKVNIIRSDFFFVNRIHSVFIKNLTDVFVETSLLFATLRIVDQGFVENSIDVGFLPKKEAMIARDIMQGLMEVKAHDIDTSGIPRTELVNKLIEIGKMRGVRLA